MFKNSLLCLLTSMFLVSCGGSTPVNTTADGSSSGGNVQADSAFVAFGQCLRDKGAIFHGTEWCPHCKTQKAWLGEAMETVRYVDCDLQRALCIKNGVEAFPTWTFNDGQKLVGSQELAQLAATTGCQEPTA